MTMCRRDTAPLSSVPHLRGLVAAAAGALALSVATANAAMHDSETCRRLKAEHDSMNASGLREIMAKGPDWAKSNLTKERLEQVKRFLSLEEDVRFRCPLGKARPELEAAESEAGATTALQPGETAGSAPAPAGAKPARKAKPQAKAAGSDVETQGSGAPATAAPAKAAAKKQGTPGVPRAAAADGASPAQDESAIEAGRKRPR